MLDRDRIKPIMSVLWCMPFVQFPRADHVNILLEAAKFLLLIFLMPNNQCNVLMYAAHDFFTRICGENFGHQLMKTNTKKQYEHGMPCAWMQGKHCANKNMRTHGHRPTYCDFSSQIRQLPDRILIAGWRSGNAGSHLSNPAIIRYQNLCSGQGFSRSIALMLTPFTI